MRTRLPVWGVAVVALLTCFPVAAADKPPPPIRAAVVYDGHLLCLRNDSSVGAWDVKSGEYASEVAKKYARKGAVGLGSKGDILWTADDSALYRWSAKATEWEKVGGYEADRESLVALVPVGETPLLVFPSKVIDPVGKRTIKAPKNDLPFRGPPLRILATHGTDTMLWIGTGNGEWGGELLGLDPKTEKWVTGEGSGYVTGVTHAAKDEVVVSWAMSHFAARTQVQVHKGDGSVKTEHPELQGKYYQRLAYSPFDKTLYGVEADEVVTVEDGKPTKVVKLKGRVLEREPHAIGVAPGVLELIPVGPKAVVVIPKTGEPWLVRDGALTVLRTP